MKTRWFTFRSWLAWKIMPQAIKVGIASQNEFQHLMIEKLGMEAIHVLCSEDAKITAVRLRQEDKQELH